MTLIHTALLSEAQTIIETYRLELIEKNPRIYKKDDIVLVISGMGGDKTMEVLSPIFKTMKVTKAINIGIVGCGDESIKIGELFCTNHHLKDIKHKQLETVDTPVVKTKGMVLDTLYDMEAKYFEDICSKYLEKKDIFIFKVVSDYLDDTIPNKEFVKQLIKKNIKSLKVWI